jgi:hypothetical protein
MTGDAEVELKVCVLAAEAAAHAITPALTT